MNEKDTVVKMAYVVNGCVAVALAVVGVLFGFQKVHEPIMRGLASTTGVVIVGFGGIVLLVLNLWALARTFTGNAYQRNLKFRNPAGDVVVYLGAVEECLSREAKGSEEVHDVKVRVFAGKGENKPVVIAASVWLWDTTDVPTVVARLQEKLKKRFLEILNIEEPVEVQVMLKKLVRKKEEKPEKPEVEGEEETFQGPQYPVEGLDE